MEKSRVRSQVRKLVKEAEIWKKSTTTQLNKYLWSFYFLLAYQEAPICKEINAAFLTDCDPEGESVTGTGN